MRFFFVWATGEASPELEGLDEHQPVSGERLSRLAQLVVQIIDGVFSAYEPGGSSPWVVVKARDSSYCAVYSNEPSLRACIQEAFRIVAPYENEVV